MFFFLFGYLNLLGWECDNSKRKDFRNISQVLLCTFLIYSFICNLLNTFVYLQEEAFGEIEERRGQTFMNRLCRTTLPFALALPIFLPFFSLSLSLFRDIPRLAGGWGICICK